MNRNLWSDFISTSGLSLELILQNSQCDCHPRVLFRCQWGKWLPSLALQMYILSQIFLSQKLSNRIHWWKSNCKIKVFVYWNSDVFQHTKQGQSACKDWNHTSGGTFLSNIYFCYLFQYYFSCSKSWGFPVFVSSSVNWQVFLAAVFFQ